MKKAYVDTPEGQVHYRTEGSGKPVLLLHATPASSSEYLYTIPILAKTHRVIAMDTLGYGFSDESPIRNPSVQDYARNIINVLKALGISQTSIVGHRTGALFAIEVAASNPSLVDKLILIGCPYYTPEFRQERLNNPKFQDKEEIKPDGSRLMEIWQLISSRAHSASPANWQRMFVNHLLAGARSHEGHQAVFRYEMDLRLKLIQSPTLLIDGTEDEHYEWQETIKGLIAKCSVKVIEGGTGATWVAYEKPEDFTQLTVEFLTNPGI